MASKKKLEAATTAALNEATTAAAAIERRQEGKRSTEPRGKYLKLDLRPQGGLDFVEYLETRPGSKTAYIQNLLAEDMERHARRGKPSERDLVKEKIDQMSKEQFDAIKAIINLLYI